PPPPPPPPGPGGGPRPPGPPPPALAASLDIAGIDAALPAHQRPLVWLAPGELPTALLEWIRFGGTALVDAEATWPLPDAGTPIGQTPVGQALARSAALGRGRVLQFAQPLVPASMPELLQPDFPDRLRALLETAPPAPPRADARAYAPLTGGPSFPETPRDLSPWLLWLAAALFALERWLASGRRETTP
ncbi:MAG: hypothetical protein K0M70_13170, partial [Arenimonas sp.]|nr:hypothetical protein [Arenimonas sp.]